MHCLKNSETVTETSVTFKHPLLSDDSSDNLTLSISDISYRRYITHLCCGNELVACIQSSKAFAVCLR